MKLTTAALEILKDAWDSSTPSCNHFVAAVDSIKCNSFFHDDVTWFFYFDNAIFSITSFDPFDYEWSPSVTWRDGSGVYKF